MSERRYWFPAKRYGWGWGPPSTWQGWVVLAIYIAVVVMTCIHHPPQRDPVGFVLGLIIASALLTVVCWVTGEPPRWRWGEDKERDQERS